MLESRTRLRLGKDVTFQSVGEGEDTVILSLGSGDLYTCNPTTADFLTAIDGQRNFGEIVDLLLERYEVSREKLQKDLTAMAEKLIEERLVVAEP